MNINKNKSDKILALATILSLLLLAASLTGCNGSNGGFDWKKPAALDMTPPDGPYQYKKGWVDGCNSGVSSTNNKFHMSIGSYKFQLDKKLRYDMLYNKAWQYGYNHCGYSMKSLAQYNF